MLGWSHCFLGLNQYSCIDIYVHSGLKPFSIGQKPGSNSKTHVQMKLMCRLNRHHWSMRCDVTVLYRNEMAIAEEATWFLAIFHIVNVIFNRLQVNYCENASTASAMFKFVSEFKHSPLDHSEGV